MKNSNPTLFATMSAVVLAAVAAAGVTRAGTEPVAPDKFTATTTAMSPSGVTLRVDVRTWSDEAARGAVVAALAQESGVHEALASLPTVGYVWQSGSAVGYSVKYAHRVSTPQGESVTFVTDKLIGGYEFKPWSGYRRVVGTRDDAQARLQRDRAVLGRQRARRRNAVARGRREARLDGRARLARSGCPARARERQARAEAVLGEGQVDRARRLNCRAVAPRSSRPPRRGRKRRLHARPPQPAHPSLESRA